MNYINREEFVIETSGKIIDIDGLYGGQCWDLFSYFTNKLCSRTFSCIETGYVIDLWNTFDRIGLNEHFVKVIDNYQEGDWLIWTSPSSITETSHIAMLIKDNKNGTNVILTQNPNGNPKYTHQMQCDYIGVVGALRPKIYINEPSIKAPLPIEQNVNVDQILVNVNNTLYCRTSPDEKSDNKVDDYFVKKGYYNVLDEIDNETYHWYKIAEDRWVAYIEGYVEYLPKKEEPIKIKITLKDMLIKLKNIIWNIIVKIFKVH